VLSKFKEHILECVGRAEECNRNAKTAPSALRDDYRMLQKHWRVLAQHYLLVLEEAERSRWEASEIENGARHQIENAPQLSPFERGGLDDTNDPVTS
jgi:hypothetical protein